ncbi:MAG TPA: cell division protein FtsQ/DivIB [Usitatibacter sp.]|nr:cell division protein FtsQ/DivIB [Usitatibacter sp.]
MKAPAWAARTLSVTAAIVVAGALAGAGWEGYRVLAARPVEHVSFAGDTARVARSDLVALAADVRGMASLDAMRERARQVPWVRDAAVRRQFPDGVEIELEAFDAIARWGDGALLSSRGEIFRAPFGGALPRIRAPEGMAATVVALLPDVRAALKPIPDAIADIAISPRGAWHVTLASGLVLEVGRADIAPRLQRFASAWPQLAAAGAEARHADLRYANGFALRRVAEVPVTQSAATPSFRMPRPARKK